MTDISFSQDDLRTCILSVVPLELKGMGLLRGQPHLIGGCASIPRDQLVDAVTEIVAYTARCTSAARSLSNLSPIPLMNALVMEFGL